MRDIGAPGWKSQRACRSALAERVRDNAFRCAATLAVRRFADAGGSECGVRPVQTLRVQQARTAPQTVNRVVDSMFPELDRARHAGVSILPTSFNIDDLQARSKSVSLPGSCNARCRL
jgi:hypothetical protein